MYSFIHPCIHPSVLPSYLPSIPPSIDLSIPPSIHHLSTIYVLIYLSSVYLFVRPFACLFICFCAYPSLLSIYLSICPSSVFCLLSSVYQSVWLSGCVALWLSVSLPLSLHLSLYLSICVRSSAYVHARLICMCASKYARCYVCNVNNPPQLRNSFPEARLSTPPTIKLDPGNSTITPSMVPRGVGGVIMRLS